MRDDLPSILYIDDEEDNLMVFTISFRKYYNIVTAQSAIVGLELLQQQKFHVVVTDQRMPEMTGVEFLSKIPPEILVTRILLTAYTETEALVEAVNTGKIFRYINKPWKIDDLRQTLDNAIDNQRLLETNQQLLRDLQLSNARLEEANEALRQKNQQLYELDKAKSEFINIISHEIKTPLNGIIGLTRLLSVQIIGEEYKEYFEALKFSVDRLDEFSKNAIFLTELQTKTYKAAPQWITLGTLVTEAIAALRNKATDKALQFDLTQLPAKMQFQTDAALFRKCLTVVLDNAVRYSPQGESIVVDAQIDAQQFCVRVIDRGPGFSALALERLFQYFGIGHMHYDQQLGLGLSLVHLAMEQLSGTVQVQNQKPQGAALVFSFPRQLVRE